MAFVSYDSGGIPSHNYSRKYNNKVRELNGQDVNWIHVAQD